MSLKLGLCNKIRGSRVAGGFVGLLDQPFAQVAAFALALRLLREKHSGGLIRNRADDNGTDKGEADVLPRLQPDGSKIIELNSPIENLNSKAQSRLGAPAGGGDKVFADLVDAGGANYDGLVSKGYDQSGNSNDATQSGASKQPKIVDSGSVIQRNGKPGVQTDGNDDFLDAGAIITKPDFTIFLEGVCINTNKTSGTLSLANEAVDDDLYSLQVNNDIPRASIYEGEFKEVRANAINLNSNYLSTAIYTGNVTLDFYSNGSKAGSITNTQPQGIDNFVIGALRRDLSVDGDSYDGGFFQEIIAYKVDKSNDRNKIETNINDFYSIF